MKNSESALLAAALAGRRPLGAALALAEPAAAQATVWLREWTKARIVTGVESPAGRR